MEDYGLHLFFLWIPSPELAVAHIKDRVTEGGHNVPAEEVLRRFARGRYNFFTLDEPLVDSWTLFDNSIAKPVLIANRKNGHTKVTNNDLPEIIKKGAK